MLRLNIAGGRSPSPAPLHTRRSLHLAPLAIGAVFAMAATTAVVVEVLDPRGDPRLPQSIALAPAASTNDARHATVMLLRQTEEAVTCLRVLQQRSDAAAQQATIALERIHALTAAR
jgi:hypothetical protein